MKRSKDESDPSDHSDEAASDSHPDDVEEIRKKEDKSDCSDNSESDDIPGNTKDHESSGSGDEQSTNKKQCTGAATGDYLHEENIPGTSGLQFKRPSRSRKMPRTLQ